MVKILFVCLGNICRSPLAMALFKQQAKNRGLEDAFLIDSCGTSNYHIGEPPDRRTTLNAEDNGIFIRHRARQLSRDDLSYFDYILAMDAENVRSVNALDPHEEYQEKIKLMRDFDDQYSGSDVPDPYFGGENGFQEVFEILSRSVNNFLDFLEKEHSFLANR